MKIHLLISGLLLCAGALKAGEQTLHVTAQSLDGWTVTDADKSALDPTATLTLPAGSQLSRSFDSRTVAVQLSTRLTFGLAGEDFPTLEIGPAALVFSREGNEGQVAVVVGNDQSSPLLSAIKLNDDGSSVEPVEVKLDYARETGEVTATSPGQKLRFSTDQSSKPVEVVISAGAHYALPLQTLSVRLFVPDASARDHETSATTQAGNKEESKTGGRRKNGPVSTGSGDDGSTSAGADEDTAAHAQNNVSLEVFTPSSVRHGNVDRIRAGAIAARTPKGEVQQ